MFDSATVCKSILLSVQRCMRIIVNKKYKLIQVMGTFYRYITFTALNCSILGHVEQSVKCLTTDAV